MTENFATEYLNLVGLDQLEKSPAIKALMAKFADALPAHFGKPTFFPAPPNMNLGHVIRANCKNKECSVRACVHVVRDPQGMLTIEEKTLDGKVDIAYSRTKHSCPDCQKLI